MRQRVETARLQLSAQVPGLPRWLWLWLLRPRPRGADDAHGTISPERPHAPQASPPEPCAPSKLCARRQRPQRCLWRYG